MTEKDLEKIFAEVYAEVYSPEYRKKIEEKIRRAQGLGDSSMDSLTLTLAVKDELEKVFLFRVLAKVLCD